MKEAEAFRLCSEEIARLDRMLTLAEVRREKALRFIAEYRRIFSKQLQQAADKSSTTTRCGRLVAVSKRSS